MSSSLRSDGRLQYFIQWRRSCGGRGISLLGDVRSAFLAAWLRLVRGGSAFRDCGLVSEMDRRYPIYRWLLLGKRRCYAATATIFQCQTISRSLACYSRLARRLRLPYGAVRLPPGSGRVAECGRFAQGCAMGRVTCVAGPISSCPSACRAHACAEYVAVSAVQREGMWAFVRALRV